MRWISDGLGADADGRHASNLHGCSVLTVQKAAGPIFPLATGMRPNHSHQRGTKREGAGVVDVPEL